MKLTRPRPRTDVPVAQRIMGGLRVSLLLLFLAVFATATVPEPTQAQDTKIVFLAGPKDHGAPGRHEYERDLRALAWALENATNLPNITTEVHVIEESRPPLELLEGASLVVLNSSGDWLSNEVHVLFPPALTTNGRTYDDEVREYLSDFDDIIKTGVGLAVFHYTMWVDNWIGRDYFLDWLGGLWVIRGSRNPNDTWDMSLLSPEHPISRGVQPWTYRDEVYSRFYFPDDLERTHLILSTPESSSIGPQVSSWSYERPDGGRSFVYGGMDFHDNMRLVDDYRRFVLNGLVWSAGLEVPEGGVQAPVPPDDLVP